MATETVRDFPPGTEVVVNGYRVEIERHARRSTFVRVLDERLLNGSAPFVLQIERPRSTPATVAGDGERS